MYGYDSYTLSPAATIAFGTEYGRYDYLDHGSLLSPRLALTLSPAADTRLTAVACRVGRLLRELRSSCLQERPASGSRPSAPSPRWTRARGSRPSTRTTVGGGLEHDFGGSTLAVRAFRQHVDDQLVTVFGGSLPGQPTANVGHYLVGNTGDVDAARLQRRIPGGHRQPGARVGAVLRGARANPARPVATT